MTHLAGTLEVKSKVVSAFLRLDSDDVIVAGTFQDFAEVRGVYAKRNGLVASGIKRERERERERALRNIERRTFIISH